MSNTERMRRLKRLNETRQIRDFSANETRPIESSSLISFGIALFFDTDSFFRNRFKSGSFPWFVGILGLVGISLGIGFLDELAAIVRVYSHHVHYREFNHWVSYWAVAIPFGICLATAWFYVGGWLYDFRVQFSGGESDIESARFVNLYSMAIPSIFLIMVAMLRTVLDSVPMPDFVYTPIHAFSLCLLIVFSCWSLVTSYIAARSHFRVRTGSGVVWFLVIPALLLFANSVCYTLLSVVARQQVDPAVSMARPFGNQQYNTVATRTTATPTTVTQTFQPIKTNPQRVRSARNVTFAKKAFSETEYTVDYLKGQRDRLTKELEIAEAALATARYEKMSATLRFRAMGRISMPDGNVAQELSGWIGPDQYQKILNVEMRKMVEPWERLDRANTERKIPIPPAEIGASIIDASMREAILPNSIESIDAGLWAIEEFLQDLEEDPSRIENVPPLVKQATQARFSALISQHQINQYQSGQNQQNLAFSYYGRPEWLETLGLELQGIIPIPETVGPPMTGLDDVVKLPKRSEFKSDSAMLLVSTIHNQFDGLLGQARSSTMPGDKRRLVRTSAILLVVQDAIKLLEDHETHLDQVVLEHQLKNREFHLQRPYPKFPAEDAELLADLVKDLKTYQAKAQIELAKFHLSELKTAIGKKNHDAILEELYGLISLPVGDNILQQAISDAERSFPEPGAKAKLETQTHYQCFQRLKQEFKNPIQEVIPPVIPVVEEVPIIEPSNRIQLQNEVVDAAFSDDGTMLVLGRRDNTDVIYSYPELKTIGEVQSFAGTVTSYQPYTNFEFSPDGTRLLCTSSSDTVRLFDTSDWSLICDICIENRDNIGAITFLNNDRFAIASESSVWLFNKQGEAIESREHQLLMHVRRLFVTADGQQLIYGQNIYSPQTLELLGSFQRELVVNQVNQTIPTSNSESIDRFISPLGNEAYQKQHAPIWTPITSSDETRRSDGEDPVWSQNGSLLAMNARRNGLSLIRFYDPVTKQPTYDFAQGDDTDDLTMMPSGNGFTHFDNGILTICRMSGDGIEIKRWKIPGRPKTLKCLFTPDGNSVAILFSSDLFHVDFYNVDVLLGLKPETKPLDSSRPPRPTLPMKNPMAEQ